ncbi:hypothetical protein O1L68_30640 [Streptomyces lydicus]|nr:hypothetical protein [Streptomyces lydicus]
MAAEPAPSLPVADETQYAAPPPARSTAAAIEATTMGVRRLRSLGFGVSVVSSVFTASLLRLR